MSRTVVITGASDGIGAAAAKMLAYPGDTLVLVGRSPEKTKAIAQELESDYFVADFAELDQVRELAAALAQKYPRIGIRQRQAGEYSLHQGTAAPVWGPWRQRRRLSPRSGGHKLRRRINLANAPRVPRVDAQVPAFR